MDPQLEIPPIAIVVKNYDQALTPLEQEIADAIDLQGYRILLKAVVIPEKTKGGIILTEEYKKFEKRSYNVGRVLKMGPRCYQPLQNYGGKPYCQVGDWVHFSSYEKEDVYIYDELCYYLNDERVYSSILKLESVIKELR